MCDKDKRDAQETARFAAERAAMMSRARNAAEDMIGEPVINCSISSPLMGVRRSVMFSIKTKGSGIVREIIFFAEAAAQGGFGEESTLIVEVRNDLIVSGFIVTENGLKIDFRNSQGFPVNNATIRIVVNKSPGVLLSFECNSTPERKLKAA